MSDGEHINAGLVKLVRNTDGTATLLVDSDLNKPHADHHH